MSKDISNDNTVKMNLRVNVEGVKEIEKFNKELKEANKRKQEGFELDNQAANNSGRTTKKVVGQLNKHTNAVDNLTHAVTDKTKAQNKSVDGNHVEIDSVKKMITQYEKGKKSIEDNISRTERHARVLRDLTKSREADIKMAAGDDKRVAEATRKWRRTEAKAIEASEKRLRLSRELSGLDTKLYETNKNILSTLESQSDVGEEIVDNLENQLETTNKIADSNKEIVEFKQTDLGLEKETSKEVDKRNKAQIAADKKRESINKRLAKHQSRLNNPNASKSERSAASKGLRRAENDLADFNGVARPVRQKGRPATRQKKTTQPGGKHKGLQKAGDVDLKGINESLLTTAGHIDSLGNQALETTSALEAFEKKLRTTDTSNAKTVQAIDDKVDATPKTTSKKMEAPDNRTDWDKTVDKYAKDYYDNYKHSKSAVRGAEAYDAYRNTIPMEYRSSVDKALGVQEQLLYKSPLATTDRGTKLKTSDMGGLQTQLLKNSGKYRNGLEIGYMDNYASAKERARQEFRGGNIVEEKRVQRELDDYRNSLDLDGKKKNKGNIERHFGKGSKEFKELERLSNEVSKHKSKAAGTLAETEYLYERFGKGNSQFLGNLATDAELMGEWLERSGSGHESDFFSMTPELQDLTYRQVAGGNLESLKQGLPTTGFGRRAQLPVEKGYINTLTGEKRKFRPTFEEHKAGLGAKDLLPWSGEGANPWTIDDAAGNKRYNDYIEAKGRIARGGAHPSDVELVKRKERAHKIGQVSKANKTPYIGTVNPGGRKTQGDYLASKKIPKMDLSGVSTFDGASIDKWRKQIRNIEIGEQEWAEINDAQTRRNTTKRKAPEMFNQNKLNNGLAFDKPTRAGSRFDATSFKSNYSDLFTEYTPPSNNDLDVNKMLSELEAPTREAADATNELTQEVVEDTVALEAQGAALNDVNRELKAYEANTKAAADANINQTNTNNDKNDSLNETVDIYDVTKDKTVQSQQARGDARVDEFSKKQDIRNEAAVANRQLKSEEIDQRAAVKQAELDKKHANTVELNAQKSAQRQIELDKKAAQRSAEIDQRAAHTQAQIDQKAAHRQAEAEIRDAQRTKKKISFGSNKPNNMFKYPDSSVAMGAIAGIAASLIAARDMDELITELSYQLTDGESVVSWTGIQNGDFNGIDESVIAEWSSALSSMAFFSGITTTRFTETLAGAVNIAKAGMEGLEAMSVLAGSMMIADMEGMDLTETIDSLVGIGRSMGVGSPEALEEAGISASQDWMNFFADVLLAADMTGSSVENLLYGLRYTGAAGQVMGMSEEEIIAATAVLGNAGQAGSKGARTLASGLLALSSPTEKAAAEMERLGISIYDAEGNLKSFSQIIDDFQKAFSGMDDEERSLSVDQLFGTEATKGFKAIGTQAESYNELVELLEADDKGTYMVERFQKEWWGGDIFTADELANSMWQNDLFSDNFQELKGGLDSFNAYLESLGADTIDFAWDGTESILKNLKDLQVELENTRDSLIDLGFSVEEVEGIWDDMFDSISDGMREVRTEMSEDILGTLAEDNPMQVLGMAVQELLLALMKVGGYLAEDLAKVVAAVFPEFNEWVSTVNDRLEDMGTTVGDLVGELLTLSLLFGGGRLFGKGLMKMRWPMYFTMLANDGKKLTDMSFEDLMNNLDELMAVMRRFMKARMLVDIGQLGVDMVQTAIAFKNWLVSILDLLKKTHAEAPDAAGNKNTSNTTNNTTNNDNDVTNNTTNNDNDTTHNTTNNDNDTETNNIDTDNYYEDNDEYITNNDNDVDIDDSVKIDVDYKGGDLDIDGFAKHKPISGSIGKHWSLPEPPKPKDPNAKIGKNWNGMQDDDKPKEPKKSWSSSAYDSLGVGMAGRGAITGGIMANAAMLAMMLGNLLLGLTEGGAAHQANAQANREAKSASWAAIGASFVDGITTTALQSAYAIAATQQGLGFALMENITNRALERQGIYYTWIPQTIDTVDTYMRDNITPAGKLLWDSMPADTQAAVHTAVSGTLLMTDEMNGYINALSPAGQVIFEQFGPLTQAALVDISLIQPALELIEEYMPQLYSAMEKALEHPPENALTPIGKVNSALHDIGKYSPTLESLLRQAIVDPGETAAGVIKDLQTDLDNLVKQPYTVQIIEEVSQYIPPGQPGSPYYGPPAPEGTGNMRTTSSMNMTSNRLGVPSTSLQQFIPSTFGMSAYTSRGLTPNITNRNDNRQITVNYNVGGKEDSMFTQLLTEIRGE